MAQGKGELFHFDWDSDRVRCEETIQCCHCGRHHVVQQAFERAIKGQLGFCARCNSITCGRAICEPCVPQEQQLENIEAGRLDVRTYRPIRVSFSMKSDLTSRLARLDLTSRLARLDSVKKCPKLPTGKKGQKIGP